MTGPRGAVRTAPLPWEPRSGYGSPHASWKQRRPTEVIRLDATCGRLVPTCSGNRSPAGEELRGCSHDTQKTERASNLPVATQLLAGGGPFEVRVGFFLIVVKLNTMQYLLSLEPFVSVQLSGRTYIQNFRYPSSLSGPKMFIVSNKNSVSLKTYLPPAPGTQSPTFCLYEFDSSEWTRTGFVLL